MTIKSEIVVNETELPKDEEKLAPFPCGVVLFDHPKDLTTGTAFLPNLPAQRIRSLNDLRNDVIWISNVSIFEDRIKSHPVVRSSYFFKLALNEIAQDVGIQSSYDGQMQPEDAKRITMLATRALTIAARAYGWAGAGEGVGVMQSALLNADIRRELPRAPTPDARWRESLRVAFTQSYQERSAPSHSIYHFQENSLFVTLRYNYVNYVGQLLKSPVPLGKQWSRIEESGIRLMDDPIAFCLANPCFVRATVEWDNASTELAALAAYGQAGKNKNAMRLWISQPELRWLSQFATLTISDIWIDESGLGSLPKSAQLPELFDAHPLSQLSYSAHLVAYNHYQAMTSETWNRRERRSEVDLWAVWLKALDRAFMFSVALRAHERGFSVERYGDGALRLRVNREQYDELIDFKTEEGFMYPDLSTIFNKPSREGGWADRLG